VDRGGKKPFGQLLDLVLCHLFSPFRFVSLTQTKLIPERIFCKVFFRFF
jgi:hypothetical protein